MKSRKVIFVIAGLLLFSANSNKLKAQFDAMFTQYMNNEMFINPAYAGAKDALALTLLHRQQWVGFKGRPITTTFSASAPFFKNKMGLGISYLNEKIGVLNRNMIYVSYSYRIKLNAKSYLRFGLMGGAHLQVEKLRSLNPTNSADPIFAQDLPLAATPNFGFGMYYNTEKFYASFSIPRMLDDHIKFSKEGIYQKGVKFDLKMFHYYLALGYLITASPDFKLKPHMMMKVALNTPMEFDLNLDALIKERLWLGVAYRTNADVSFLAGVQITPALLVSYSYDYQVTKIREYSGGSHEIMLSYIFDYRGKKIVSPRYF